MPTVPRRGTGYVQTQPLPPSRLPAAAFEPLPPIDISSAQHALGRYVQEERQKQDQVAILDADNKLGQLETDLAVKASQFRGKDALGAKPAVDEDWQKGLDEIRSGLSNDDQRMAFERRASGRYQSLYANVAQHTETELRKYDDETTDFGLKQAVDSAIKNYTNPAIVERSLADSKTIVDMYARRNGLPPEETAARREQAVSQIHTGVLSAMLAKGDDLTASKYFGENKAELTGPAQTEIGKALEEGSLRGESQRRSDEILAADGVTRQTALEAAKKITDPKVRDATETRINNHFSEKSAIDRETSEANMLQATNIVEKTGSIDNIPPTMWSTFTIGEREALRGYNKAKNKGIPIETDWSLYYTLQSLASADVSRDRFLRTNLLQYRARLGDTEFKQLTELQSSLRKGDSKSEELLDGVQTSAQIVNDGLNTIGIDPTPKAGSDEWKRVSRFRRTVDSQVRQLQIQTGKKAKPEEVQGIVDNLLVKGAVSGKFLGIFNTEDEKFQFERAPGEGPFIVNVSDVPQGERVKIEAALKRSGQPVSDANVLRLYQQRLSTMVP